MTTNTPLPIRQLMTMLLEYGVTADGKSATIYEVAEAIEVTHQSLMHLIHGKTHHPRLHTLQRLSAFYGVPLDYFDCTTHDCCRAYLIQRHLDLHEQHTHLQHIHQLAGQLTPWGCRQVLTLMTWVEAGKTALRAQQQRKGD